MSLRSEWLHSNMVPNSYTVAYQRTLSTPSPPSSCPGRAWKKLAVWIICFLPHLTEILDLLLIIFPVLMEICRLQHSSDVNFLGWRTWRIDTIFCHHVISLFCESILPLEFLASLELKDSSEVPVETLLIIRLIAWITKRIPFQSILSIVTPVTSLQYLINSQRYRLGTVNPKSFIGKVLLRIKWKFELNYTL